MAQPQEIKYPPQLTLDDLVKSFKFSREITRMERVLINWRQYFLRVSYRKRMLAHFISESNKNLVSIIFINWRSFQLKFEIDRLEISRIDDWRDNRIKIRVLCYWKLYFYQQTKLKILLNIRSRNLLKLFFTRWNSTTIKIKTSQTKMNDFKLNRILNKWILHTISEKYRISARIVLQNDILFNSVCRLFKHWRQRAMNFLNVPDNSIIVYSCFHHWRLEYKLKIYQLEQSRRIKLSVLENWINKTSASQERASILIPIDYAKSSFLQKWLSKTRFVAELHEVSLLLNNDNSQRFACLT